MPQVYTSLQMNRFNVERKQGDSRDLDRQYQSSPTATTHWPSEADRIALRRDASTVYSTTSSTATNKEIHEQRRKIPFRTASNSRDARRLGRGMLPPPCPPQEPPFASLDCNRISATGACSNDFTDSAINTVVQDEGKSAEHPMILVTPGQWIRWRGADETWRAIQHDEYEPCLCLECGHHLFCMSDAWLVLCPHCYSISPLEANDAGKSVRPEAGIGLGFTLETLFEVQASAWRDY
jgi:hypothetical protein